MRENIEEMDFWSSKRCGISYSGHYNKDLLYLIISMCPFLAARWRHVVLVLSIISLGLSTNSGAHILLLSNKSTTYISTYTNTNIHIMYV